MTTIIFEYISSLLKTLVPEVSAASAIVYRGFPVSLSSLSRKLLNINENLTAIFRSTYIGCAAVGILSLQLGIIVILKKVDAFTYLLHESKTALNSC